MQTQEVDLAPIVSDFYLSEAFVSLIIGPIGSGKTLGSILRWEKLIHEQEPSEDGIRYTRTAVIRNTSVELRDTTIKSFEGFFGDQLKMNWGNLTAVYEHGDVHAEILFRALDKPGDMKKLLSMEITFAYLNELRELPKEALENVTSRLGRYPSETKGAEATNPCAWADTNAFDNETWIYKKFIEDLPNGYQVYEQPPAILDAVFINGNISTWEVNPEAENLENLPKEYYGTFIAGKSEDWVRVMIMRQYIPLQQGKPVYPEYNDHIHCIPEEHLRPPSTEIPLVLGGENGRTSAVIFAQVDSLGRVTCFDELTSDDMGAEEFGKVVKSHIERNYTRYKFEMHLDPACNIRSQLDDKTQLMIWNNLGLNCRLATTNSPKITVEAVKSMLNTMIQGRPALTISSKCKMLRKAMNGSYQYKRINASGERYGEKPDKGPYSHVANALEYLVNGLGTGKKLISSNRFREMAQRGNFPTQEWSPYD